MLQCNSSKKKHCFFLTRFDEEMIESLFGAPAGKNKEMRTDASPQGPPTQYVQIIDPKKAQNLSILLKALNVTTEEVCDALQEGKFFSVLSHCQISHIQYIPILIICPITLVNIQFRCVVRHRAYIFVNL